jgi:hypothetical protein
MRTQWGVSANPPCVQCVNHHDVIVLLKSREWSTYLPGRGDTMITKRVEHSESSLSLTWGHCIMVGVDV